MKQLNLRLPDDLHAALSAAAEADRRSLNSMVIVMIEEALKARAARGEGGLAPSYLAYGKPIRDSPLKTGRRKRD
jgi:hypothetical protein